MEVRSVSKYVRVSPFKAREITRAIQGLSASDALDLLTYTPRKSAELVRKTLKSAIANAEHNHQLNVEDLIVSSAFIGEGPTLKRHMPRARGSAGAILKRTSHITVVVSDDSEVTPNRPGYSGRAKRVHLSPEHADKAAVTDSK